MMLRWWLLSLLSSAVVISSLHLWRHRPKPAPVPVAESEPEDVVAVSPPPRLAQAPRVVPRPVRKPVADGMARVRGRILGVLDSQQDAEETLSLVFSGEDEELEIEVEVDGSFAARVPPGTYRVHAEQDELEATLEELTVEAGDEREVILQMTQSASIEGTLRPAHDKAGNEISVFLHTRISGENGWSEGEEVTLEDNQFAATGLVAGKRYDLLLTAAGFRPVELAGISAPSKGLSVDFVRLAHLRGGFGIARGEKCPIGEVTIVADDETRVVFMDHFCRFEASDLPPVPRVRVQVSEDDLSFDMLVDIPPHGDPPFLCLRSLCREPAADELSSLEVSLVDGPDRGFMAHVAYDHVGEGTHAAKGQSARFVDLPSGATVVASVYARPCQPVEQTLVLQPGVNRVSVTCQKR